MLLGVLCVPTLFRGLHLRGRQPSWARVPRPSPRESGALPTVRVLGSQNPCTALSRGLQPPRDSRGNTRAPPWGDTHSPPPPPSAPRAPSSPKEYGRFRVGPKVGAWPCPSSTWAPPRGLGSRPLRTWSRPAALGSPPPGNWVPATADCSTSRADGQSPVGVRPRGVLRGSLSAPLLTHIEISLLSAMAEQ